MYLFQFRQPREVLPCETFVITKRDAGDATCRDSTTEFALCEATGKCCLSLFGYVAQKAMKLYKAKSLF